MKRARPRNKKKAKIEEKVQKKGTKKQKKSHRGIKTIAFILLSLMAAFVAVNVFKIVTENNSLTPLDGGRVNVLLLGVDGDGLRTDTMIVASYDTKTSEMKLLSIPRDTKVYVENREMTRKMTEVHAINSDGETVGAVGTLEAVTQITGIPLHYYVEFSFETAEDLIDILGPFTFDVPDVEGNGRGMNYDDPYQNLHIHLKPGEQVMNGKKAVQFMRYRKSNFGGGDGDHKRMERQQEIIKALVDQKLNASLILKLPDIFSTIKNDIKTNLTSADILKYSKYLTSFSAENIESFQLPGEDKMIKGVSYFIYDEDEAKAMIAENFCYDASNITDTIVVTGDMENAKELMQNTVIIEPVAETEEQGEQ